MKILDFARFAALFASATLLAATGASAQEGMFAKDLLGSVGIIPKERPRIDYRERAPLVLPPKMELRDPADPQALHAANPQWPNDPDVARREAPRGRRADSRDADRAAAGGAERDALDRGDPQRPPGRRRHSGSGRWCAAATAAARTPGSIPTSCAGKAARRTPSSPRWRSRSAAT